MTIQVSIAEAQAELTDLIARAEAGEAIIIARDGVPVVVIHPAPQQHAVRRAGFLADGVDLSSWNPDDALDEDDPRDWGLEEDDPAPALAR
jgi:prevent-host-death family protein